MRAGLLVISHGSREAGWVSLVDRTVETVREALGSEMLVEAAFLELVEGRLIQDGVDRLESAGADHILALPLFVSSGSTHVDEIGWALGAYEEPKLETDLARVAVKAELTYGRPMDDAPEVVDVLLDRLAALSSSDASSSTSSSSSEMSVLLIGHGSKEPGFKEAWQRGMKSLGEQLVRRGVFRGYSCALLQLEEVGERYRELTAGVDGDGSSVLVAPLFLSEGYFTATVIPRALDGLACRYDGRAYMPHPRVAEWVTRQAREWLSTVR